VLTGSMSRRWERKRLALLLSTKKVLDLTLKFNICVSV
jgi:hypothetical protein